MQIQFVSIASIQRRNHKWLPTHTKAYMGQKAGIQNRIDCLCIIRRAFRDPSDLSPLCHIHGFTLVWSVIHSHARLQYGSFQEPLFMELLIPLSERNGPLYRQIYLSLRQAILSGTLRPGERLPSTREMAENSTSLVPLYCLRMISYWPKAFLQAATAPERSLQKDFPCVSAKKAPAPQNCACRILAATQRRQFLPSRILVVVFRRCAMTSPMAKLTRTSSRSQPGGALYCGTNAGPFFATSTTALPQAIKIFRRRLPHMYANRARSHVIHRRSS